ncbi:hypothetical protein [Phyllobacterium zundukense]|jgi:hypothetical protein|uniref:Uncharacterized protein n=1 Tax=Phyllobacterium zundukense TaxID=1867719 RepID=A0ACD4D4Z5_9HYPH|nr:hypothetical protein [Phyllobacterium zundukense]UXN60871.1 hypothetical protein N8E88_31185 [Phyllobacterium zundukense]
MKSEAQKSLPFYQLCAPVCAMIFAMGLAGCSTSGSNSDDPNSEKALATAEAQKRITASELTAFCPTVTIREGTSVLTNYGKSDKTPENLIYQASISNQTRSCQSNDATMTMNVAVSGKVVPGPKFTPGTITVPIRVAVIQGTNVLYSTLHKQAISASDGAATQFVFNDPNVSFPKPTAQNIQVFIGFDEGPASAASKSKPKTQ